MYNSYDHYMHWRPNYSLNVTATTHRILGGWVFPVIGYILKQILPCYDAGVEKYRLG